MTNTTTHRVGLDVHANQTHLCALDPATGEVSRRRVEGPPEAVLPFLEELGKGMVAAYEAGPPASFSPAPPWNEASTFASSHPA
jgi:hypothetical protein